MLKINVEVAGRGTWLKEDVPEALSKLMQGAISLRGYTKHFMVPKIDFRPGGRVYGIRGKY
jgi:hypothetical protein